MQITKKLLVMALSTVFAQVAVAQNQLVIPPLMTGPTYNLNVQADSVEFYTGHKTPTYGVNGALLGPTIVLNKWDNVMLNVTNTLPTAITMHWHGLHVPAMDDGGPHQIINTGSTWSPMFTVLNDAATYWYHPHGEHKTDLQVSKGITGLIIIRDSTEAALALPRTYGVDDFPLIIQTKAFDVLYQVTIATALDTLPMVNGTVNPFLDAPAQVVRLRMLNGSSDRSYMLGFSNNMNFSLIATDGGLVQAPVVRQSLLLAPGERAEILVDLSGLQGQTINLMNFGTTIQNGVIGAAVVGGGSQQILDYNLNPLNGADYQLLQINVIAQTANPVTTIPSTLVAHNPWNVANANYTRNMTFTPQTTTPTSLVEGPFTINGHMFDMHAIEDTVYLNNIEIWSLTNQTMVAHPFHIHDVQFYIVDINGNPPPDYLQGKKDVVLVDAMSTVNFITKFEDFADPVMPYMYHCHLLHHEDDGMMGSFIVLDSSSTSANRSEIINAIIYPNPVVQNFIRIKSNSHINAIRISDVLGKKVSCTFKNVKSEIEVDISELIPGSYFIQLENSHGNSTYKFVRQ